MFGSELFEEFKEPVWIKDNIELKPKEAINASFVDWQCLLQYYTCSVMHNSCKLCSSRAPVEYSAALQLVQLLPNFHPPESATSLNQRMPTGSSASWVHHS